LPLFTGERPAGKLSDKLDREKKNADEG